MILIIVIELSGVQFGLKSYVWFQSRMSVQRKSYLKSKYDFRPTLHSTQFSYQLIKSILKSHNFMALNFRFWCNVPRRTGLFEMAEPETLWHVIWHGKRCHVTKTHSCITSKQAVLEWERKHFDWRFRRLNQWWKAFLSSVVEAETSRCLWRRNLRMQAV